MRLTNRTLSKGRSRASPGTPPSSRSTWSANAAGASMSCTARDPPTSSVPVRSGIPAAPDPHRLDLVQDECGDLFRRLRRVDHEDPAGASGDPARLRPDPLEPERIVLALAVVEDAAGGIQHDHEVRPAEGAERGRAEPRPASEAVDRTVDQRVVQVAVEHDEPALAPSPLRDPNPVPELRQLVREGDHRAHELPQSADRARKAGA